MGYSTDKGTSSAGAPCVEVHEELAELIPVFIAQRMRQALSLGELIAARDFAGLLRFASQLEGSAAIYGFAQLAGMARELRDAVVERRLAVIRGCSGRIVEYLGTVTFRAVPRVSSVPPGFSLPAGGRAELSAALEASSITPSSPSIRYL